LISESRYWKEPLLETAKVLRSEPLLENLDECDQVQIEKEVMIGFYSIRKLLDTVKVSDSIKRMTITLTWFENKSQVDILERHDLDKLYDLSKGHEETRKLRFICDQFIHSYVFIQSADEKGRLNGFYFSSDKEKNNKLYFMDATNVITIFEKVGENYPTKAIQKRNDITGAWEHVACE